MLYSRRYLTSPGTEAAVVQAEALGATLETAIVQAAIRATQSVVRSLEEISHHRLPPQLDFTLRLEMLAAYLHLVNRIALRERGPKTRDALRRAITERTIGALVAASWDTAQAVSISPQTQDWLADLQAEVLNFVREADADYTNGQGTVAGAGAQEEDLAIESRLAARISQGLHGYPLGDRAGSWGLRAIIIRAAIESRTAARIVEEARRACQRLD